MRTTGFGRVRGKWNVYRETVKVEKGKRGRREGRGRGNRRLRGRKREGEREKGVFHQLPGLPTVPETRGVRAGRVWRED